MEKGAQRVIVEFTCLLFAVAMALTSSVEALAGNGDGRGAEPALVCQAKKELEAGLRFLDQKQPGKAIAMFKQSAQHNPSSAFCFDRLGLAYQDSGDFVNAEISYRTALRKTGHPGYIYDDIGCMYAMQNRHKEALAAFAQALKCGLPKDTEDEVRCHIELEEDALKEEEKQTGGKKPSPKNPVKLNSKPQSYYQKNPDIDQFIQTGTHGQPADRKVPTKTAR